MVKQLIRTEVNKACAMAGYDVPAVFDVDAPPKQEWGDFSTNIALMIGQVKPELVVGNIADEIALKLRNSEIIAKVEIAGPGFINITVADKIYFDNIVKALIEKENYGKSEALKSKKINVEYISANPTGPLHVGNARGGPLGEALARLFEFLGAEVEREFYINDVGGQVDRFAESLFYWYEVKSDSRVQFPEGGYKGEYIKAISEAIQTEHAEAIENIDNREELIDFFKKEGLYQTVKSIREDCELIGIKFDKWIGQSDIQYSEKSAEIIRKLEEAKATVKREGAIWFKDSETVEVTDRESVLQKSDEKKTLTYFADDIAYHLDKFERGFARAIDIWGANHHGHVPRLKSALKVLGLPDDWLEIILYQYVRLKNAGEVMRMAKREGSFVTLREVIESGVAPDAFKYFILAQNPNTPFDFDLKLASDTSEKNPVYYIKYAHARITSILRKASEQGTGIDSVTDGDLSLLKNNKEITLYKELAKFPGLLEEIRQDFQIQALPHFAYKIAGLFHDFYTGCQVLSDDKNLTRARLSLVVAVKYVLANSLFILDIEASEKM